MNPDQEFEPSKMTQPKYNMVMPESQRNERDEGEEREQAPLSTTTNNAINETRSQKLRQGIYANIAQPSVKQIFEQISYGIYIKTEFSVKCINIFNEFEVFELKPPSAEKELQELKHKGVPLFECKELSTYCIRACLRSDARQMQIAGSIFGKPDSCLFFRKSYKNCLAACCIDAQIEVFLKEKPTDQETYLGKVVAKSCMNSSYHVYDEKNEEIMTITVGCCKAICRCAGKDSETTELKLCYKGTQQQQPIVKFHRPGSFFCPQMDKDTNNFACPFPEAASYKDKIMLLAACIFIQYCLYDDAEKDPLN